jgi:hypothetical protein
VHCYSRGVSAATAILWLETSGIVFGIKDSLYSTMFPLVGEQGQILHYLARQTGGEFFKVAPEEYATALESILTQLHFRYQLGFYPTSHRRTTSRFAGGTVNRSEGQA